MKKSSKIYVSIIALWLLSLGVIVATITLSGIYLFKEPILNKKQLINNILVIILLSINGMILSYFWLNSIKDFIYSLIFSINKKRIMKRYDSIINIKLPKEYKNKKVLLLYCTCNDFDRKALESSMIQDYTNYETIILDDSSKEEYIKEINEFSKEHNLKVVRRKNKAGFKAGNLNNYLKQKTDYDYFVVLDSDEIIPKNYIKEVLKYFYYSEKIGVVQACHLGTKGTNAFQSLLGMSIDSTSLTAQVMKNFYGANALIGHGMTISKECYEKSGGFPHVVAEDICFAVEIKKAGFDIIYAPNIVCHEEFPNDYISLKKRQCKWTQGNVEYMKKYSKNIKNSKMTWYEKLDLKLSHYSLPIIPIISLLLVINAIILGFLNYKITNVQVGILVLSFLFLLSPLLPNMFVYAGTRKIWLIIPFFIVSMITYASLSPMMIRTVILAIFGKKARFLVTPKGNENIPFRYILYHSIEPVLFGVVIGIVTYFAWKSILPTIILTICCVLAPFVIALANINLSKTQVKKGYEVV